VEQRQYGLGNVLFGVGGRALSHFSSVVTLASIIFFCRWNKVKLYDKLLSGLLAMYLWPTMIVSQ